MRLYYRKEKLNKWTVAFLRKAVRMRESVGQDSGWLENLGNSKS